MRHLLGETIFWIAAVCCLVAQVAIVRSTMRSHAPAATGQQVPRPRAGAELAWVLLPALLLAGVFALTWRAMHEAPIAPSAQVSVTAPERPVS